MSNHVIVPVRTYYLIFLTLMVCTAITVAVAFVDLGPLNAVVAMTIAVLKATLVVLFFMHVEFDRPLAADRQRLQRVSTAEFLSARRDASGVPGPGVFDAAPRPWNHARVRAHDTSLEGNAGTDRPDASAEAARHVWIDRVISVGMIGEF